MRNNRCRWLAVLCGIALVPAVLLCGRHVMVDWQQQRVFKDVMAGDFSAVQELEDGEINELAYVYQRSKENSTLSWIQCDLNGDGKNELIMTESFQNGRESVIMGIFMAKGSKCIRILWDVNDYTSCYYLVGNMVIHYSENYGMGTRYCYVKHEVDSEGKVRQTKRFEIIDISEEDDIAPDFLERGFVEAGTYYVVTDYEKDGYNPEQEVRMSREEWLQEFYTEIGDYDIINLKNHGAGRVRDQKIIWAFVMKMGMNKETVR